MVVRSTGFGQHPRGMLQQYARFMQQEGFAATSKDDVGHKAGCAEAVAGGQHRAAIEQQYACFTQQDGAISGKLLTPNALQRTTANVVSVVDMMRLLEKSPQCSKAVSQPCCVSSPNRTHF